MLFSQHYIITCILIMSTLALLSPICSLISFDSYYLGYNKMLNSYIIIYYIYIWIWNLFNFGYLVEIVILSCMRTEALSPQTKISPQLSVSFRCNYAINDTLVGFHQSYQLSWLELTDE